MLQKRDAAAAEHTAAAVAVAHTLSPPPKDFEMGVPGEGKVSSSSKAAAAVAAEAPKVTSGRRHRRIEKYKTLAVRLATAQQLLNDATKLLPATQKEKYIGRCFGARYVWGFLCKA
jgi:hypothetical protein